MIKKTIILTLTVLAFICIAHVPEVMAQPGMPSVPEQAPAGFIWLAAVSSAALGFFAIRRRK